jgi:hypothetical protein
MFIDSHCHIDFPELMDNLPELLRNMQANQVTHALAISVDVADWSRIKTIIETYPHIYGSVGTHPDYPDVHEPTVAELVAMLQHPKVIATGETGLDYFRLSGDLEWQRQRFRNLGLAWLPFENGPHLPRIEMAGWAIGLIFVMGGLLLLTNRLYQFGMVNLNTHQAVVILPFELVVGAVSSWLLAGEVMSLTAWLGGSLIIAAGLVSSWWGEHH